MVWSANCLRSKVKNEDLSWLQPRVNFGKHNTDDIWVLYPRNSHQI